MLGIFIVVMARQMRSPVPGFGPEIFPTALGVLLLIFGGVLTLQGFAGKGKTDRNDDDRRVWIIPFVLALTVVYIAGLLYIPFLIATPVYLTALIRVGKSDSEGRPGLRFYSTICVFAVIVSGMTYFVFRFLFRVALI